MTTTKFRGLTIKDVTPKNCKRVQLEVYHGRVKELIGFVSWDSHDYEYYMKFTGGWKWNGAALREFGALLDYVKQEYGK